MTTPPPTTLNLEIAACHLVLANVISTGVQSGRQAIPNSIIHSFATIDRIETVLALDPSLKHLKPHGTKKLAARIHESGREIFMLCLRQGLPMSFLQWMMNDRQFTDASLPFPEGMYVPRALRLGFVDAFWNFQHGLLNENGQGGQVRIGQGMAAQVTDSGGAVGGGQVMSGGQATGCDQAMGNSQATSSGQDTNNNNTASDSENAGVASGAAEPNDERNVDDHTGSGAQQTEDAEGSTKTTNNETTADEVASDNLGDGSAARCPTTHTPGNKGKQVARGEQEIEHAAASEDTAPTQQTSNEATSGDQGTAESSNAEQANDNLNTDNGISNTCPDAPLARGAAISGNVPNNHGGSEETCLTQNTAHEDLTAGQEAPFVVEVEGEPIGTQDTDNAATTEQQTDNEQKEAKGTELATKQESSLMDDEEFFKGLQYQPDDVFDQMLEERAQALARAQSDAGEGSSRAAAPISFEDWQAQQEDIQKKIKEEESPKKVNDTDPDDGFSIFNGSDAGVDLDNEHVDEDGDGHGADNDPANDDVDESGALQASGDAIASASDHPTPHDALYSTNDEVQNASSSADVEGLQADPNSEDGGTDEHTMDVPLQSPVVGGSGASYEVVGFGSSAHEAVAGNEVLDEHNGAGQVPGEVAENFMTKAEGKRPARG